MLAGAGQGVRAAEAAPAAGVDLIVNHGGTQRTTSHASLAAAIEAAIAERRVQPATQLRIELGAGTHRIMAPVVLPVSLSGTPGAPTVITSKKGAKAVISGAQPLRTDWRFFRDGIYVTALDASSMDQLWINGQRQVRARYPNYDATRIPFGGVAADALSPARVARWANPAGGEVHAMQAARWGSAFFRILGKQADGTLKLGEPSGNNRVLAEVTEHANDLVRQMENAPHPVQRFVENIFEELDAPGEWFFDAASKKLYYMPGRGVDLATAQVEATALEQLIVIDANQTAPVHDIRIEGVTLSHTARTVIKATEPMLRSDWAIHRSGALMIEGAERVVVADSDFVDLGGNAVFVSGYNRAVAITGNRFEDVGSSAISFIGRPAALRTPLFQYADAQPLEKVDRTPGPRSDAFPAQSLARDNLITHIGTVDKQAAGVTLDIAQGIVVSHNSIYQVPRAGINIGDGAFGGHTIEFNDVFETVLESNDHGSFNSWGRDRYWHPDMAEMRRRVALDPALPFLETVAPIVLRNNRWQTDDGFDVDLDDGSSNYEIYNNVMLRGGLKLREGFRRIVYNNVIVNNGLHPHVSFKQSGDVFKNNIVMGPYQPVLVDHWDFDFDRNLFATQIALRDAQNMGSDKHSGAGDPRFVDAANGDFTVRPDSPALALGFKNFPMEFGVESARLRAMARTPAIPALLTGANQLAGKTYNFSGATIKSLETLGEQSATGAPDRAGALVIAVEKGSHAEEAGLQKGDLIRSVDVWGSIFTVADAPTLLVLQASQKWQKRLKINLMRQQRTLQLGVLFK